MQNLKPSRKNFESGDSPHYLQISNTPLTPSKIAHSSSKRPQVQSSSRFSLSKESPFHKANPTEKVIKFTEQKSCYNVLKDNQEFKIGENPNERSKYFIKTRLPPLEVYNCLTNETKVFERPDIVKREASGYEDIYNRIYKNNFNAFHKKNGEMEGFLDKSKVVSVFGDLTLNKRGVVSKENSFLPSIINKSRNNGEKSFLSNSVLNSKLYSQHEVSKMNNISTRKELENNYSFWSLQKNRKSKYPRNHSSDMILNENNSLVEEDSPSKILLDNNITLEVSQKPYHEVQNYKPTLYSEENIDYYGEFEEKVKKMREIEKQRIKNLKVRLEITKNSEIL